MTAEKHTKTTFQLGRLVVSCMSAFPSVMSRDHCLFLFPRFSLFFFSFFQTPQSLTSPAAEYIKLSLSFFFSLSLHLLYLSESKTQQSSASRTSIACCKHIYSYTATSTPPFFPLSFSTLSLLLFFFSSVQHGCSRPNPVPQARHL